MLFYIMYFFRCKCLDDIKASFLFGYPDELVFKLYERKGRCFMSLERPNEAATCFEEALNKGQKISKAIFHPFNSFKTNGRFCIILSKGLK